MTIFNNYIICLHGQYFNLKFIFKKKQFTIKNNKIKKSSQTYNKTLISFLKPVILDNHFMVPQTSFLCVLQPLKTVLCFLVSQYMYLQKSGNLKNALWNIFCRFNLSQFILTVITDLMFYLIVKSKNQLNQQVKKGTVMQLNTVESLSKCQLTQFSANSD